MNRTCLKCGNEIIDLKLSDEQSVELWGLQSQNLKLFIIQKLKEFGYSHNESKIIMDHLNPEIGKCFRCNYEGLEGDHVDCPKCKSFNYNIDFEPSFNQEFCTNLEYSLNFDNIQRDDIKGYWCDGIDHLPANIKSLAKSSIEKDRIIITKAWIGKDGQDIYEMRIKCGNKFVEAYTTNHSLLDSIPNDNEENWIDIDPVKKQIEIRLK